MTIRANRPKVLNWVEFVFTVSKRKRLQMMNVNEIFAERSVHPFKYKSTSSTIHSMMLDTRLSGTRITLIRVNPHLLSSVLDILQSRFKFVGIEPLTARTTDFCFPGIVSQTLLCSGEFHISEQFSKSRLKNDCLHREVGTTGIQ